MAESLIDKVRRVVKTYEDKEANIGMPRNEEFNYQMAQALIAVDDVLKKQEALYDGYEDVARIVLQEQLLAKTIRKAIESTNGDE